MTKNFDLTAIEEQKISKDISSYTMLVYGPPKIGKTTFMHKVYGDEALILATEKGYKALAGAFVFDIGNWTDFIRVTRELKKDAVKKKYKTIIIDTVDLLYNYVEKFVLNKHDVDALKKIPYGAGWDEVTNTLFDGLNAIEKEGYTLAFISHAKTKMEKLPESEDEYEKYIPTIKKRGLEVVTKMVDNILFAAVALDEEGHEQRVLYSRETMQWQAGARFPAMSAVIPLDANAYNQAMIEAIEAEGEENLKEEREVSYVVAAKDDFTELMATARQLGVKFHKAGRMPELTAIVEKHFGTGKKLTEATETQIESLAVAVEEMEELIA